MTTNPVTTVLASPQQATQFLHDQHFSADDIHYSPNDRTVIVPCALTKETDPIATDRLHFISRNEDRPLYAALLYIDDVDDATLVDPDGISYYTFNTVSHATKAGQLRIDSGQNCSLTLRVTSFSMRLALSDTIVGTLQTTTYFSWIQSERATGLDFSFLSPPSAGFVPLRHQSK